MAHAGHRTGLQENKTGPIAYRDWLAMSIQPSRARRVERRHGYRRPLSRSVTWDGKRFNRNRCCGLYRLEFYSPLARDGAM
jgi:hypothetical protein